MTSVLLRKGGEDADTHRRGHVSSPQEDGQVQAKKKGLRRNLSTAPSDFQNWEAIHFCCLRHPVVLCHGCPSDKYREELKVETRRRPF